MIWLLLWLISAVIGGITYLVYTEVSPAEPDDEVFNLDRDPNGRPSLGTWVLMGLIAVTLVAKFGLWIYIRVNDQ